MSNSIIKQAISLVKEQRYYDSVQGLMGWDLWAGLSENGQPYRNEVSAFFTKQAHEKLTSKETEKLINSIKELDDSAYADAYEKAAANALVDRYKKATQIPVELQTKLKSHTSIAQKAWQESWKLDSFDYYKPYMKELFEIKKEIANAIDPNKNPFDVLCEQVDKGISTKRVSEIFANLKVGIVDILKQIEDEHKEIDDSVMNIKADVKRIRDMAYEVNALTDYDYKNGKDSETVHGMCTGVGPKDSRIAISYQGNPWKGMFTMLHEGGHGRYNHNSCEKAIECGVWGGVSGATHEAQARFYENIVGRSLPFIEHVHPVLVKHFPEIKDLSPEQFYKAILKAKPALIRIYADELTYSLHPIIRYEIEQDYFNGKITIDQFMEAWNSKYEECFGLTPTTMRNGVLQDIHWSSGHIGYFQSYTLGNLYGGQLLDTMLKQNPNFYTEIGKGDFNFLNKFMYDNVHQFGNSLYTPDELIKNATGESLNEKYYLNYLRNKYLPK